LFAQSKPPGAGSIPAPNQTNKMKMKTNKKIKSATTYFARSVCDFECVFQLFVINRTAKMATIQRDGKTSKTKIHTDCSGVEYLRPDNYSMAPIFRAA
jgi:hypothetical protein